MTLVRRSVSELGTIRLCSPCPNAALLEAATEGCRLLARRWQAEADLDVFLRLARVGNVEAAVFFDEECARMVYGYLKLFMLERACSVEHHSPQLQFLVAYHLHFGGIADDADGAVLPVFLHFIGSVLAGYHDVGVCGSRRLHAVVEVQSEDILVYAIFRSGMVDIIPCAALCLLGYGYLPAVREEIGHIVVEHPLRRAVVGCGCFLGRNDFAGTHQNRLVLCRQALVDGSIHFGRGGGADVRAEAYHFIVEEEPGLAGSRVHTGQSVAVCVGRYAIKAVRHAAGESGSTGHLPVIGSHGDGRELRGGGAGYACPVPYGEDIEIFVSGSGDIGASVGHEVSLQVLAVAVFTACSAGRHHAYVKGVVRAYVQGIVGTVVVRMFRAEGIVGILFSFEADDDSLVLVSVCSVQLSHAAGKERSVRLVGNFWAAHATAQYIEQHVTAPDGSIIRFAHEFAQQCQFLLGDGEAGTSGVRPLG